MRRSTQAAGFTIIELMITILVFSILTAAAVPTMRTWLCNVRVRSAADALQNGLRLAQTESLRRSRQVVFSLTNDTGQQATPTATANGSNWTAYAIPFITGETITFLQSGVVASSTSNVTVLGQAEVCFNSVGRLVANGSTGVSGSTCTAPTTAQFLAYSISMTGADHPLQVNLGLGGQIHLCDPSRTLSSSPDGC